MTKMSRRQRLSRLALIATAMFALAACSTNAATGTAPGTRAPTSSSAQAGGGCETNPASAPMPAVEEWHAVPANARISVALKGIDSGTIKPGDPPTEIDVTLCNNSPVDYPNVGVALVLTQCSCAVYPEVLPVGTGERFDAATNSWVKLPNPVITGETQYLRDFTEAPGLPKGKAVTLRYRVALDASMADGTGAVQASAVVPHPLVEIGRADLPFAVSKQTPAPPIGPRPTELPFSGLDYPGGVAVSSAGDVYLADSLNDRVLKLATGSHEQTVLPFTGLHHPGPVAVDAAGNVYVVDRKQVLKLAPGANEASELPFSGLTIVDGVAADSAGNVYVSDYADGKSRIVKLAAGSNAQTVLPFEGMAGANALAVDDAGSVYVNDGVNTRVLKLAADATEQTVLPLTGVSEPQSLAVDAAGDIFVIDHDTWQMVKFAAGSSTPTVLPSAPVYSPAEVAVDDPGNVYVVDRSGYGQVVKLAAG
jgi:streptogramin lyase